MNNKKILLITLLTIPIGGLIALEDDVIATTRNDDGSVDISQYILEQQNTSLANKSEENEFILEQLFLCQQEGQEGGVVCQMYECINNDCHAADPIQLNNNPSLISTEPSASQEPTSNYSTVYPEEQKNLTHETKETSELIMENIEVPSFHDNEEIRELESEIKSAEKMCERAESDPREKAICEAASAKVQWRKEKIKALENVDIQENE